jgi:hypothetical protein
MDTEMTPTDIDALELAIRQALLLDADTSEQIEWKLKRDPRIEVALLAAYVMQVRNLRLDASQQAPMDIDDPDKELRSPNFRGNHDAARLLKRMTAHGVSRYHPDPMTAIAEAKR